MQTKIKRIEKVLGDTLGSNNAEVSLVNNQESVCVTMLVPFKDWVANGYQIGDAINVNINWDKRPKE